MKTCNELLQEAIDSDVEDLKSYKDYFMMQAALNNDTGKLTVCNAYMQAALEIETCIQGISTIPSLDRTAK